MLIYLSYTINSFFKFSSNLATQDIKIKIREKSMIRFKNRSEAGKQLATKLTHYKNTTQSIVLGLPRGGVVTAFEVAQVLNLPLDIVVPRKIGAPDNPELAIGAVTADG